jgi:SNF2 family DNA or RNA helicase
LQSEDRAHRIGQKKSVTYIDLIAEKTIDEKIVKALRKKIDIASQIMGEELKDWI